MKTITIFSQCECKNGRHNIFKMHFLSDADLWKMAGRLLGTSMFNTIKGDRQFCVGLEINGTITYLTDYATVALLNICKEYKERYNKAEQRAKQRTWQYAWAISSEEWKQAAILRQMKKQETIHRATPV